MQSLNAWRKDFNVIRQVHVYFVAVAVKSVFLDQYLTKIIGSLQPTSNKKETNCEKMMYR